VDGNNDIAGFSIDFGSSGRWLSWDDVLGLPFIGSLAPSASACTVDGM
jgi:hypothetical protein